MRKLCALLLALTTLLMVAGCGGKGDTPSSDPSTPPAQTSGDQNQTDAPAAANESITLVNTAPIPDYDPLNWYITSQSTLFTNVYSTLVDVIVTDDLQIECRPNLAKSWETEEDGLVWVFHLNENAIYSDGSKVTAEHVKTCFERQMTNPYTMGYVSMIDSIEVRDENTVAIRLSYTWPSVPNCWYMIAIYNVDLYDADKEGYMKSPVGSGPYELTTLDETAGTMTLTRKDSWWGDEQPAIKTVNVRTITDPSTLVIALQSGEVDVGQLSGSNLRLVEGDQNLVMKQSISQVPSQLLINKNTAPFDNDKLREAISYAIDYDAIRNATCSGYVSTKDSSIVYATLDMEIPEGVRRYTYDPEKARQLVAESGLSTPIDVGEIIGGNNNGSAEMVQQYLDAVGIKAAVTSYETNTFVQMAMGGQFGLCITSGSGGQSAFENLLNYYGSGQPYNFNKFSNSAVDELLGKMQLTSDPAETAAYLEEALNIVVDEHTNMNLGIPAQYTVYNKNYSVPPMWNGIDMIRVK